MHSFFIGFLFYSFSFFFFIFCLFFHYPFISPVLLFSFSSLDFIFPFVLDLILFFISWHSLLLISHFLFIYSPMSKIVPTLFVLLSSSFQVLKKSIVVLTMIIQL